MLQKALALFLKYHELYLRGAALTLWVSLTGTLCGLVLGFGLSALRGLRHRPHEGVHAALGKKAMRLFAGAYVELMRGTPMIAQGVFLYYAVYKYLKWSPLVAAGVIVSLNTAAYMAEIVRAGIQSVDPGQREAALSIGMGEGAAFRWVVLPQAVRNAFPSIGNEFVVNIKDTSVLNAIALTELFFAGMSVAGTTYDYSASMLVIVVIYFMLTFTVTRFLWFVEKRLNLPRSSIKSTSVPSLLQKGAL